MLFPYDRYQTSTEPFTLFYPAGEEQLARWISATLTKASQALSSLLAQPVPEFEVLIVKPEDWPLVPHGDLEEGHTPHLSFPVVSHLIRVTLLTPRFPPDKEGHVIL